MGWMMDAMDAMALMPMVKSRSLIRAYIPA